jgi:hypothetical protein
MEFVQEINNNSKARGTHIMEKNILLDKASFILHKIVFGFIYQGAAVFLYKLENTILKVKSNFLNFLSHFIIVYLLIWFFNVNRKKNIWKPFGKINDTVEIITVFITMFVLYIKFGMA